MVPRLIRICRIQWCYSLFFTFKWKYPFWANLVQKMKIVTLSWILVATVIWTCRIQWWFSFFLFLSWNALFGQICSKKSKLSFYAESWYLDWFEYVAFNDAILFLCFLVEIPFFGKFVPKNQNSHFRLKFGSYSNLNMQNLMNIFIPSVF